MPNKQVPIKIKNATGIAIARITMNSTLMTTAVIEVTVNVRGLNLKREFASISGCALGNRQAEISTRVIIKSSPKFSIAASISSGGLRKEQSLTRFI